MRIKKLATTAVTLLVAPALAENAAAQTWTQLSPAGAPPAARVHHSAVLDPGTGQMIVFGGLTQPGRTNDVWRLSDAGGAGAPTWTQVFPTGPIPATRWIHRGIYDEVSNRMVVFGGGLGFSSPCTNQVWVLSNANGTEPTPPAWTQLAPSGAAPAGRFGHSVVYDPITNSLIIHGGSNCFTSNSFNDVWVLSNANGLGGAPTWTQLFPTGGPVDSFVNGQGAAYDAVTNRMIVFGGQRSTTTSFAGFSNEVWVLSNANGLGGTPNWTQLSPTGVPPSPRGFHTSLYDPNTNRMTVFGGFDVPGPIVFNDTWVLENANGLGGTPNWTELAPSGGPPPARHSHSAVYDPVANRMVIFGGTDPNGGPGFVNDTWVLTEANGLPADTDNDGLDDVDEIAIGTDPNDPDTDDDGLLDGTEVDIAMGGECPDPLNPDSDGDTLLDGAEVALGTDACNPDSDGDGVDDGADPTPLDSGVPPGFLEGLVRTLSDEVRGLDPGLFNGPNLNANRGRRNALANRARGAANDIAAGDFVSAIDKLQSLLDKIDGEEPPPDWMDDSAAKTSLAIETQTLIALLVLL